MILWRGHDNIHTLILWLTNISHEYEIKCLAMRAVELTLTCALYAIISHNW